MAFRDRFYTPATARAILSWRLLLGLAVGIGGGFAGLPVPAAVAGGAAVYAGTVLAAMPGSAARASIDPFMLGEPWRQIMQQAESASRRLRATVQRVDDGPLKSTLTGIAEQLEHGLAEAWVVAQRGDEIDDAVRRLDPTGLRSKLATLRERRASDPSADHEAAIESVERQLESAARLEQQSTETAATLRLTQTRLDELVAQASEVQIGTVDTASYRRDVDRLVIELEALRQAVEETRTA